jgi:hypothetical protein
MDRSVFAVIIATSGLRTRVPEIPLSRFALPVTAAEQREERQVTAVQNDFIEIQPIILAVSKYINAKTEAQLQHAIIEIRRAITHYVIERIQS